MTRADGDTDEARDRALEAREAARKEARRLRDEAVDDDDRWPTGGPEGMAY